MAVVQKMTAAMCVKSEMCLRLLGEIQAHQLQKHKQLLIVTTSHKNRPNIKLIAWPRRSSSG
jgi:hypothetical protein